MNMQLISSAVQISRLSGASSGQRDSPEAGTIPEPTLSRHLEYSRGTSRLSRPAVPARPPASTAACNRGRRASHRPIGGVCIPRLARSVRGPHPSNLRRPSWSRPSFGFGSLQQQARGPPNPHASGRIAPIAGGCSSFLRPAQQYEPQSRAAAARACLAHRCCSCTPPLVLILSRGAAGSGRG